VLHGAAAQSPEAKQAQHAAPQQRLASRDAPMPLSALRRTATRAPARAEERGRAVSADFEAHAILPVRKSKRVPRSSPNAGRREWRPWRRGVAPDERVRVSERQQRLRGRRRVCDVRRGRRRRRCAGARSSRAGRAPPRGAEPGGAAVAGRHSRGAAAVPSGHWCACDGSGVCAVPAGAPLCALALVPGAHARPAQTLLLPPPRCRCCTGARPRRCRPAASCAPERPSAAHSACARCPTGSRRAPRPGESTCASTPWTSTR